MRFILLYCIHDDTEENVLCVYPDGTYKEIPCIKLRTAVVNSMTTEIGRDSYVPTDYPEVQKMNETVWLKAVEDCILSTINVAKTGRWVKLKDVKVKTISSRFVFQVKYRVKDNKHEAFCRWTPRGFDETPGEHYDPEHIFAGTPQLGVLRYILTKALYTGQSTFHFDFKRAFPSTPLDRVIYVKTPKGYTVHTMMRMVTSAALRSINPLRGLNSRARIGSTCSLYFLKILVSNNL